LIHTAKRCLAFVSAACIVLALLAGCAGSRMLSQQANPEYTGKPFKSVMVVAVTADEIVRRTFEDRIVALLAKRGVKGIPAYTVVTKRGRVQEAELREAVAGSNAEAVLVTRVIRVERSSGTIPAASLTVGYGTGFYGFYSGVWDTVNVSAQTVTGPSWTLSEARLFDAKNGVPAWTGIVDSPESNNLDGALTQYINIIFDAMVQDRVL
jgi:hypothetical protein